MASKVDVLAVMDEAAQRFVSLRELAGFDANEQPSRLTSDLHEARAAVAELIEAARAHGEAAHESLESGVPVPRAEWLRLTSRLAAALARVGAA